ncbi:MAG: LptA/OstA family protein [Pyramidobacter sp.]|nr:LptA/OstA family protein [Pyramidobacter sp.]
METQLSAKSMDYDTESGEFQASGSVALKRLQITITSDFARANSKTQKARMWQNVKGFGTHLGEKLSFACDALDSDFSVKDGDYTLQGGVDAVFGSRHLVADIARLRGRQFYARPVTKFEDVQRKLILSCDSLVGNYDAQGLRQFTGNGNVYVKQINVKNEVTEIWGDKLIYSREKGTLTATGNARAVQKGRRITAKGLVYHVNTGRLEAQGTPRITVDLSQSSNKTQKQPALPKQEKRRP